MFKRFYVKLKLTIEYDFDLSFTNWFQKNIKIKSKGRFWNEIRSKTVQYRFFNKIIISWCICELDDVVSYLVHEQRHLWKGLDMIIS